MVAVSVALLVSLVVCMAVIRFGPSLGFVDRPDGALKSHTRPIVPLGGLGVFAGVHAAMAAHGSFDPGLFAATTLVLLLGLVDDRVGLSPGVRLVLEVAAGVVLGLAGNLPSMPGGGRGVVVAVLLVVVAVNAVNLFDGLDGLVGGTTLVTGLGLALLAAVRDTGIVYGLVIAAAVAGFLVWNWHPARLFLGDNGAYSIAVFLVYGFYEVTPRVSESEVVVAAGLLGVFAVDLVTTLVRRRLAGLPLFAGDRSHVYDQLRDRGRSVPQVAWTMAGAQALIVAVVVAADGLLDPPLALVSLSLVLVAVVVGLDRAGFLRPEPT